MSTASPIKSSIKNSPSREKSSQGALSHVHDFERFILSQRVMPSKRGDLLALYQTLIGAGVFSVVTCWAELYRFHIRRGARDDELDQARKLFKQYRKHAANLGERPRAIIERRDTS